jgi:hypothetical protein
LGRGPMAERACADHFPSSFVRRSGGAMIRVLIADDHPIFRQGSAGADRVAGHHRRR